MPPFSMRYDQNTLVLTTPALTLGFSLEDGGLRELRRAAGPDMLGYGAPMPAIDVQLDERGWLAGTSFVRYLRHMIDAAGDAVTLVITIGLGPLTIDDCFRITGTLITRHVTITNVGEDTVRLHGLRIIWPWARVGAFESCRFDAPSNSVRPHVPLAVAAQQRRNVLPRRFFAPGLRDNLALERAPSQGPGVLALHDPAGNEALLCWFFSQARTAQPQIDGNNLALTLIHEVEIDEWLHSEARVDVANQYLLLLHEPWPAALAALGRTWPLCGLHPPVHPVGWLRDAAIYETHPAFFGGFAGLAAALPGLCRLGLNTVCLLPVWAFANRKDRIWDGNWSGSGNPYAIRDFEQIDPTLGTADDLRALVAAAHALDMRVLIELPLEGCAADARLAGEHPDWFCTDADGQAMPISAQPDLLAFNWSNAALRDYMFDWAVRQYREFQLDGLRLVAPRMVAPLRHRMPGEPADRERAGVLALIERVRDALNTDGRGAALCGGLSGPLYSMFHDGTIDQLAHHMFVHLALNRITPAELGAWLEDHARILPRRAVPICFTENYQTRLINPLADGLRGSRLGRMLLAGIVLCGFVPLIYAGQEHDDPEFIGRVLRARAQHAALRHGSIAYNRLQCSSTQVFAVLREAPGEYVLGLLNVGPHKHTIVVSLPVDQIGLADQTYELFELFEQRAWVEEGRRAWARDDLLALQITLEPFGAYGFLLRSAVADPADPASAAGSDSAPIDDQRLGEIVMPALASPAELGLGVGNGRRTTRRRREPGDA